ncbi:MAG: DUF255 domain-containing protein [Bacteroidia bacterium]|nr:DUF255 domain-containing protein [Bacteroidia bacterium]
MKPITHKIIPLAVVVFGILACAAVRPNRAEMHGPEGKVVVDIPKAEYEEDTATKVAETIEWLDFESGYAKAAKENKMLMIDVYTDWCGWCKVMDKKTFSNDTIIAKLNQSFVMVKMNPEKARNYTFGDKTMAASDLHVWLGYGKTFGYPTSYFMIAPGTSDERYAQVGYLEPWEFSGIIDIILSKKK